MPEYCGGFGIPQRIIVNSRALSFVRTTGATESGKTAGIDGRLPAYLFMILNRRIIASWFVVIL
jgi:hypothetical protein